MPTTPDRPVKSVVAESDLVAAVQSTTTESMSATLSQLFDKETLGVGGLSGLPGFGLRAAMPKLPSFKKRPLPPVRQQTPDSSDDESSEKRSNRRKRRRSSSSRSSSAVSSRRSSRSSPSSSRSRAPVDNDELRVEKIESSDDDMDAVEPDVEPERVSSSETESDSDESSSPSSSSDDEQEVNDLALAGRDGVPSVDTDDRSQADSLSSIGPIASEISAAVEQENILPMRSDSADPLEQLDTMTVEDKYTPMFYDHCYIKDVPDEATPTKVAEPIAFPKTASSPPDVPAISTYVVEKTEPELKPSPRKRRKITFPRRPIAEEEAVLRTFESVGFDEEDLGWLRIAFEQLAQNEETPWAHKLSWLPPPTVPAPGQMDDAPIRQTGRRGRKKVEEVVVEQRHKTGCARTEGYYKLSHKQKRSLVRRAECTFERTAVQSEQDVTAARQQAQAGREARSMQRRILTSLGTDVAESELLKVNQLKYRKKMIKFGRSQIHGWGLYALETIAPDEMIVEYVGQKIRFNVADKREKNYEKIGIGSSYLFRIDADQVIDATKRGNLARFINHSCQPNCYAKIVTVDSDKRIVIYSKSTIRSGEEITYDYKFPVEDDKIDCLCGAPGCRGTLN